MTETSIAARPASGLASYDDLGAPFIDETWDELLAYARHARSLEHPAVPPRTDDVAIMIDATLFAEILYAQEPRMAERMTRARPYVLARLDGQPRPSVSLVDILTTLDRLVSFFAFRIERLNSH